MRDMTIDRRWGNEWFRREATNALLACVVVNRNTDSGAGLRLKRHKLNPETRLQKKPWAAAGSCARLGLATRLTSLSEPGCYVQRKSRGSCVIQVCKHAQKWRTLFLSSIRRDTFHHPTADEGFRFATIQAPDTPRPARVRRTASAADWWTTRSVSANLPTTP